MEVIHLVQHQALVALVFRLAFLVLPLLTVVAVVEVDMVQLSAVALVEQEVVVLVVAAVLPQEQMVLRGLQILVALVAVVLVMGD